MAISVLMALVMASILPSMCLALDCRRHVFAPQCRGIIAKRGGWTRQSLALPADYSAVEALPQLLEGAADADDDVYKTYEDLTYEETSPNKNVGELTAEDVEQEPLLDGGELWVYPRGQMTRLVQQRRLQNAFPVKERWGRHRPHFVETTRPGGQFRKLLGRSEAIVPKK
ncbi:hypothetical protein FHG87_022435 [Trinorchestia longiramus]|nr:hypothetical protein FHG87_022435 [Trinorchestia longiramus]